jgi:hypothetical protein
MLTAAPANCTLLCGQRLAVGPLQAEEHYKILLRLVGM